MDSLYSLYSVSQCRQAGQDLTDLLTTPQVEHFLFGTPMSVLADKQIYKHGALRKVQCTYTAVPSVYLHAWFILIFMCHSDTQVCSQKAITIGAVTVHIAGNTIHLWHTLILSAHVCPGKPSIAQCEVNWYTMEITSSLKT